MQRVRGKEAPQSGPQGTNSKGSYRIQEKRNGQTAAGQAGDRSLLGLGHSRLGTWDPSRQGPTARSRTQHPQPPPSLVPQLGNSATAGQMQPRWGVPGRARHRNCRLLAPSPYVCDQCNTFRKKSVTPLGGQAGDVRQKYTLMLFDPAAPLRRRVRGWVPVSTSQSGGTAPVSRTKTEGRTHPQVRCASREHARHRVTGEVRPKLSIVPLLA